MNRRNLLRGFVGAASGLLVPASVGEVAAEVERRWWALGAMPGRDSRIIDVWEQDFVAVEISAADWMYSALRVGDRVPVWKQDGSGIQEWATVVGVSGPHPVVLA